MKTAINERKRQDKQQNQIKNKHYLRPELNIYAFLFEKMR